MYGFLRRFASASRTSHSSTNQLRSYASFTLKDVVRDYSDETGTLLYRFAKHIAVERYKCVEHVLPATKIRYSDYFPISDENYFRRTVQQTAAEQLPALIIHAFSYRPNAAAPLYANALNTLDAHAVKQLQQMDTTTVLETLYAFLFLMPNWVKRLDFYKAAITRLAQEKCSSSKYRFLQICFYMGLQKQPHQSELEALLATQLGNHLPNCTDLDLAVISNAAYKTSTLVTGTVREDYEAALVDATLNINLIADSSADALFISFIKALRLQRVHDERICKKLQEICLQPEQLSQLDARGMAHVFAYFAELQWDQPDCIKVLVDRLIQLKSSQLRPKDLSTFLWSCAQLNCNLNTAQLKQLELIALRKLDNGEYDRFADQLVDTCLSLCIMGYHSKQLFDAAEELRATQRQRQRTQPKVDSRLTVLRTTIAIEQPSWTDIKASDVYKEFASAPGYLLKQRDDLTAYASHLTADAEVEAVDVVCPLAGINLPSLRVQTLGEQARVYYVELLTSNQTLKFSKAATSLVRLKRRLLETQGQRVILLQSGNMATNAQMLHQLLAETKNAEETLKNEANKEVNGLINSKVECN